MDEPKVTVICLAYNQAPYIRDALEGFVRQQTTFSFEVVVHDDASTDGTADIIREYGLFSRKKTRIRRVWPLSKPSASRW